MPGTSTDPTLRTVQTDVFADHVGEQIASQRHSSPIASVFAAEMRLRTPSELSAEQLAVWANDVSTLILSDPLRDSEGEVAQRAMRTVLRGIYGGTITVIGPWIRGETVTIAGEQFRVTGDPCPTCITNPLCQLTVWGNAHCPTCGWSDAPL